MYTPQPRNYKKYARNRLNEIIAYDYIYSYINRDDNQTWEEFSSVSKGENILVIISEKYRSAYHVFNTFFPKILKYCRNIAAVAQVTEDVPQREIRGYTVGNRKDIEILDKNAPCLIIALEDYDEIVRKLYDLGFKRTYSFFDMECGKKKEWYKRFLRFRLRHKTSSIVLEYMNRRYGKLPFGKWKDFKRKVSGRKLFVFGSGRLFQEFYKRYAEEYKVECILDNARSRQGTKIFGISIDIPDRLREYSPEDAVILIATIHFEDIYRQLLQMGYDNCYVYPYMESLKLGYRMSKLKSHFLSKKEIYLYYLYRLFPIDKKKITVLRHYGKGYGCHSKYIVEELIRQKIDCKIIWLVNDIYEVMPNNVIKIENTLKNRVFQMATARIWLDNDMKVLNTRKRKGQFYINTWHGTGISLKKFYLDDSYTANFTISRMTYLNANIADIYLAGSSYIAEVYHSAFAYRGRTEITGSPRVDILINGNSSVRETVRTRLGLTKDQNLILYAPTLRIDDSGTFFEQRNVFQLDFERICNALHERWGGEWVAAVRLHPRMPRISSDIWHKHHLLDLTSYQDVQELLLVAEILVTDYSSIMFDMGYAGKKVFLYTEDEEEYKKQKDLLFPMAELPFPKGRDQQEMEYEMMQFDEKTYSEKLREFNARFGILEDGKASGRVVELIEEYLV